MAQREYDVIIVGASFAGLAVASKLKGKVLLIDRADIGTFQISACGTPLFVLEEIGCEDCLLKRIDIFSFHVNNERIDFKLPTPFCTFDYKRFCKILNSQNSADFVKANVIKVEKGNKFIVHTTKDIFSSRMLVDASGWRATAAESLKPGYVHYDMLSFGIETELPFRDGAFHFFYDPSFIKDGISWLFACGSFSRFGVASYVGATKLNGKLEEFTARYGLKPSKAHGGFFCYCLKEPVVEGAFVVGCAQGQTLPVTGEGIRGSLFYGRRCGAIIQRILECKISLDEGRKEYASLALSHSKQYDILLRAQRRLLKMRQGRIALLAKVISRGPVLKSLERRYLKI